MRQVCRVYLEKVPDDTTLLRWASLVEPATLAALNERVVELARGLKVARGRKLRLDSTVVATTIHHPSDSSLPEDGVRVLSRLLRRARAVLGGAADLGREVFRTRTRSVRRLVQSLHRLGRRQGAEAARAMRQSHARLIAVAERTRRQAARVGAALIAHAVASAPRLAQQLEIVLPRVERAPVQAERRVLRGEAVPAGDRIVSLFEPHTQIIVRHKAGKPVEFGGKLWLEEVEGGIVSGWRLLEQAGPDAADLLPSLAAHRVRFGRPARLVAADRDGVGAPVAMLQDRATDARPERGVFAPQNEAQAKRAGVNRVVLPATGRAGTAERARTGRQRWFRRGFRFRAGIEGRISVCSGAMAWIAAATTARMAWAVGSAGAS